MISQCAEKGWDSMKPEEKYEHIFKCISEICFDYFLSTKTQELLKVNINNTFSQLIDAVFGWPDSAETRAGAVRAEDV